MKRCTSLNDAYHKLSYVLQSDSLC